MPLRQNACRNTQPGLQGLNAKTRCYLLLLTHLRIACGMRAVEAPQRKRSNAIVIPKDLCTIPLEFALVSKNLRKDLQEE